MKLSHSTTLLLTLFPALVPLLHAGETTSAPLGKEPVVEAEPPTSAQEEKPWKFSLDSRFRWEFGDQDGRDESNAFTLRNRVGVLFSPMESLSMFAEYEGTLTADRDSYQAASVHGLGQNKTIIADPESHELNQLWLSYSAIDTAFKVGRQRLILDNARFVGNVGWRQNEQTYDAVTVKNTSIESLTLFYGYINRVNRIFGSGDIKNPGQEDFEGDSHLANVSYSVSPSLTLTGYAYFLDLHTPAGDGASNNTYGLQAKGAIPAGSVSVPYLLEGAYQTDGADSPRDYGAWYYHAKAGIKAGKVTAGVGFSGWVAQKVGKHSAHSMALDVLLRHYSTAMKFPGTKP